MADLALTLFGTFKATLNGEPLQQFRTVKVQALLIYLATEAGVAHRREALMELLWPGLPLKSAQLNLRQTLFRLRKMIPELTTVDGDRKASFLLSDRLTVRVNSDVALELDVSRFDDLIGQSRRHDHLNIVSCFECQERLSQAVKLYNGSFLADFYLTDSNDFEDWAAAKREAYRRQALDALDTLAAVELQREAFVVAQTFARQQIEIDYLDERAYRRLFEALARNGQRNEALAEYDKLSELLGGELGMEPATRTTEIVELIRDGDLTFEADAIRGIRGYELGKKIGAGMMGTIHLAIQPTVGRKVAVKVIRRKYADDPEFIRRFETEAQTIARLEHPYIVPLYDYWRDPDGAYLVMRYLRGGNLLSSLEGGPWELEAAARMLDQVAAALNTAHRQGVVHRDIKPANILLDEDGNSYLTDFGIAKDLTGEVQLAAEGAIVGTPDYISPEQINKEPISPQTDLYSLGGVLYETLTGEKPFPNSSLAKLIFLHLNEPVPLVGASRPDLPAEIDQVIQRATAKRPGDRYADALEMAEAFRAALGGLSSMVGEKAPFAVSTVTDLYNPYKGLRAFQEADAEDFFGREALVDQFIARLNDSRFMAIVGPSGSGKSSAVKAGLLPALRQGVIPGSEKWFVAEMTPGTHPLEELELALWPIAVDPPPSLVDPMGRDTRGMLRTLRRIIPAEQGSHGDDTQLLLVIDQFEELFTLVEDPARRAFFLDSLIIALNSPRSPLRVVITLRADFYDRPLQIQPLGQLLKENTEIVLPLSPAELTWAVREPARQVGVSLERGLSEAIVADVADQPGALPLLQYALTELFERRDGRRMTRQEYDEIGGVAGALGKRAEEIYAGQNAAGQEAARQLFLRLVTLGEGSEDTRRRVSHAELTALGPASGQRVDGVGGLSSPAPLSPLPEVIDAYGDARLLTFDHDPVTRVSTVEVAHEALLREWPRLRGWLEESRNDVRLQRLLAGAAVEWQSSQRDDGYLLRGSRLEQFADWAESSSISLTQDERHFLDASIAAREARVAEDEARRRRELETAQKLAETEHARAEEQSQAASRLQRRAVYLGVALAAAVILVVVAVVLAQQSSQNATVAQANADLASTREAEALVESEQRTIAQAQAEEQAQLAFSRELAAAALNDLDIDPERSILLALEALSAAHTLQAENVLHEAVQTSRLRQTFNVGPELWGIDYSPDGRQVATGEDSGRVTFWDIATGEIVSTLEGHVGYLNGVVYNRDGTLLASAGDDNASVWDLATDQELFTMDSHTNWVYGIVFSPDGKHLATSSSDGTAKLWDVEASLAAGSGQELHTLSGHTDWLWNINFSPDGSRVATASSDGTAKIWDVASGEELLSLQVWEDPSAGVFVESALFSPDGRRIIIVGGDLAGPEMSVWDATSGERLYEYVGHTSIIQNARVSPDGSLLATVGGAGTAKVWDLSGNSRQALFTLSGHTNWINDLAFSPDGRYLVTASRDGTARVWDISPSGNQELLTLTGHTDWLSSVAFSPDGKKLATSSNDETARVWDSSSGQSLFTLSGHEARVNDIAFSPDGTRIATAGEDNLVRLWDAATGRELLVLSGHTERSYEWNWNGIIDLAFSPDGARLATAGVDGQTKVWNVESGQELLSLAGHPDDKGFLSVAFSPDGKLLAAGADQPSVVKVWDAETGEELFTLPGFETGRIFGLAFNPVKNQLALGNNQGAIVVWQLPDEFSTATDQIPQELFSIPSGHSIGIRSLFYSQDGGRFVTASDDGSATVWEATTGQPLLTLSHSSTAGSADFSQDGTRLAVAYADGIAQVYSLDLAELKALAQSRVTRVLTTAECQQYLHLEECPRDE